MIREQETAEARAAEKAGNEAKEVARAAANKAKKKLAKEKAKARLKESIKAEKAKQREKDKARKKRAKEAAAQKSKPTPKAQKSASLSSSTSSSKLKSKSKSSKSKSKSSKLKSKSSTSKSSSSTSTNIVKTKNPTKNNLKKQIRVILKTADMQTMTAKSVRKQLEKLFGCELKPRKNEVTELLKECINDEDDEDGEDGEDDEPTKKRGGYTKQYEVSTRLSKLLGSQTKLMLTRNDLTKQIVLYMKEKGCQNDADKREFLLDSALKKIFKVDIFTYFSIHKYIGTELTDLNPNPAPRVRKPKAAGGSVKSKKRKKNGGSDDGPMKKKVAKDPNAPKRNKNGFMWFSGVKRVELVKKHPSDKIGDIAKKVGAMWRELSEQQKAPYEKMAADDKKRYTKEAAAYSKTATFMAFAKRNKK